MYFSFSSPFFFVLNQEQVQNYSSCWESGRISPILAILLKYLSYLLRSLSFVFSLSLPVKIGLVFFSFYFPNRYVVTSTLSTIHIYWNNFVHLICKPRFNSTLVLLATMTMFSMKGWFLVLRDQIESQNTCVSKWSELNLSVSGIWVNWGFLDATWFSNGAKVLTSNFYCDRVKKAFIYSILGLASKPGFQKNGRIDCY